MRSLQISNHPWLYSRPGCTQDEQVYGNVIPPESIMNCTLLPPLKQKKGTGGKQIQPTDQVYDALGPDALRLWVASSDYTRDVAIGQEVLQTVHISLHKLGSLSNCCWEP